MQIADFIPQCLDELILALAFGLVQRQPPQLLLQSQDPLLLVLDGVHINAAAASRAELLRGRAVDCHPARAVGSCRKHWKEDCIQCDFLTSFELFPRLSSKNTTTNELHPQSLN